MVVVVGRGGGGEEEVFAKYTYTCNCGGTAPGIMLLAVKYSLGCTCLDCIFCTLLSQLQPWSGQENTQNMFYNDETLMTVTLSGRITSCTGLHVAQTMEPRCLVVSVRLHTHTHKLNDTHCLAAS